MGAAPVRKFKGTKPVIYLDQNWLSNITKALDGRGLCLEKSYFCGLFDLLREGVANNRFVVPTSDTHETEASFSDAVDESLWYVAKRLCRGLQFNSSNSIRFNQLFISATEYAQQGLPETPWWHVPFNQDSDTRSEDLPDPKVLVHLPLKEWAIEQKTKRDTGQHSAYSAFKKTRQNANLSYPEEVDYGRRQLVLEGLLGTVPLMRLPEYAQSDWAPLYLTGAMDIMSDYLHLARICASRGDLNEFLQSPQFSEVPFFDIYAKLRAADIVRFPQRIPEPSLLDDFTFVATVLPYVSFLATENYMAELIKQTKVGDKYGCKTFTMRQKDALADLLRGL